jgi:hypothetical protein
MRFFTTVFLGAALSLSACGLIAREAPADETPPAMRWDHVPHSAKWTEAALAALASHGAPLVEMVPADAATWCPAYPDNGPAERAAFWAGMLSTLAKHESTWRPDAVGGGGKWYGLVQILPGTARGYKCTAQTGQALKDGPANLSCAIRILTHTVVRDGVVARGGKGMAADWGPFHSARKKADMLAWIRKQSYCSATE